MLYSILCGVCSSVIVLEIPSYSAPWIIAAGVFDREELGIDESDEVPEISNRIGIHNSV